MSIICALTRTPKIVTRTLNAIDRGVSATLNAVGGGFAVCQHAYGDWSKPVEKRAHKYGFWRVIKRDAILISTSKHRTCIKCGDVQTHTIAAGQ